MQSCDTGFAQPDFITPAVADKFEWAKFGCYRQISGVLSVMAAFFRVITARNEVKPVAGL